MGTDTGSPRGQAASALGQATGPLDLDLVLVTGAGASHEFGSNHQKLPLMADWSNAIVQKLMSSGPNYLEATGLKHGMSGEDFETVLGRFLRAVASFPLIEQLIEPSASFPGMPSGLMSRSILEWHQQAVAHFDRITNLVQESLFEQFNLEQLAPTPATQAYGDLFRQLGVNSQTSLVYATTNYDSLGEHALLGLGRKPDCGELLVIRGAPDPPVDVGNLLGGMPRYTPVLHLHGKVGWYLRKDDSQVHATNTSRHDPGFGVPIVMLPDPAKAYDIDVIATLWSQFTSSLSRARRVLVLGHSLADRVLVQALHDHVTPPNRLAITVYGDRVDESDLVVARIREELPGSVILPMQFGIDSKAGSSALAEWRSLDL